MLQFPPFGDALDTGRARPCVSSAAIPPTRRPVAWVWWPVPSVRRRAAGAWRPHRRPPRRKMADIGLMGEMFCDAGNSGTQFTPAAPPRQGGWGFCTIRSILSACRRRVAALMVQFPRLVAPSTWGELDRAPLMPQFPRLVAVRPRFGAVWRPKCRPPRRKTPKLGCRRRGGLRYGHNGVKSRVLWRLVEAASFRVVVCWFSACCGVMPPRARRGRRVLYQWTQAAVSRSTARRSRQGPA